MFTDSNGSIYTISQLRSSLQGPTFTSNFLQIDSGLDHGSWRGSHDFLDGFSFWVMFVLSRASRLIPYELDTVNWGEGGLCASIRYPDFGWDYMGTALTNSTS